MGCGVIRRLRHHLATWAIRAIQRFGRREVRVLGRTFRVSRSVFNPRPFATSAFMARHIEVGPDDVVLDVGTGSGIQAIVAAETARETVAVDINPEAVRCARENAQANGVGGKVAVLESDLFAALDPGPRFSLILFTPAYLEGTPERAFDHALFDPGKALLRRFFAEAGGYLAPGGRVQMVYSSIARPREALAIAGGLGWRHEELARTRAFGETLRIYTFRPPPERRPE